jgi:hypothetical protein
MFEDDAVETLVLAKHCNIALKASSLTATSLSLPLSAVVGSVRETETARGAEVEEEVLPGDGRTDFTLA